MTRYAYAAWDETQGSVALAPDAILEALTNDLLQRGDLNRALSEMLRRRRATGGPARSSLGRVGQSRHGGVEAWAQPRQVRASRAGS